MACAGRVKEKFDFGWMFHKGDIPIENAVKSGAFGGLTDCEELNLDGQAGIAFVDLVKKAGYDTNEWVKVDLPHDWCVEENFVRAERLGPNHMNHGYLPLGVVFYRKEFTIPEEDRGKTIRIEFDGAMKNTSVWVNGHFLGNHDSGSVPFSYDLSAVLRYGSEGRNVVFVKVNKNSYEGWWYEGGGIYRHVWLIKTDRLHVGRFGTFVTTPEVTKTYALVNVKTKVRNDYATRKHCTLVSAVVDQNGSKLAQAASEHIILGTDEYEFEQEVKVADPRLWSPETPHLYKVIVEVRSDGEVVDTCETMFGIRTFEFIAGKGFFLNGEYYVIKGTCNHQDYAGVGVAIPDALNEYRIRLLKEMGSNAYRSAHHPPTSEILDICDKLGMLVIDENRRLDSSPTGISNLKAMLLRDRNHPSVFLWCIENEEALEGTAMGTRILKKLVEVTHKIDPTRPATAAMNKRNFDSGYGDTLDVVGYNYGQNDDRYIKHHEMYPHAKMICTESTSSVTTRGVFEDDPENGYCSSYETSLPSWTCTHEKSWQDLVKFPFLSGIFVWTGFAYRGEPTPYAWPCVTSHFGIMDLCGLPKDAYYYYKSVWTKEPMVHIMPHWDWPGWEGQEIEVWTFSNCEDVELFLNGVNLGRRKVIPNHKLVWKVPYSPGRLEAKASVGGKTIACKAVETTSPAARIDFEPDRMQLQSDGCDVSVIRVAVKDSAGRVVPTADNLVRFSVEGPGRIIGVGNGDPSSHEPDKANMRRAFNGFCIVIVQSTMEAGEIKLKAASTGLKGTELIIICN